MAYIPSHKGQSWLLPPNLEDLIPRDHVCFLVESLVDSLDYAAFDRKYSGAGRPAYHPRVLLKILVMGVLDRVRSSRRLARGVRENVVYMRLAEALTPDFRTLSDFRKNNPEMVKEVFRHTVRFAKAEGLLDVTHLATDGTKIRANASNAKMLTKDELEKLARFADEELEAWAREDAREDEAFGEGRGSDQLPGQSKEKLRRAARRYVEQMRRGGSEAREEIRERLREAGEEAEEHGLKRVSVTDPESRFMKNAGRVDLCYNAQMTVERGGFAVAGEVSQNENDVAELEPQVKQTEENLGGLPGGAAWSFDAGYSEGGNVNFLAEKKIDGYIPDKHEKKEAHPYDKKHFRFDAARDEFTCPENQRLVFEKEYWDREKEKTIRVYKGVACAECPARPVCTKQKARRVKVFPFEAERRAMAAKMKTPEAREIYKWRGRTVEPAFGDLKANKGLRRFLTRGLRGAQTEFMLACAARNIGKIWASLREKTRGGPAACGRIMSKILSWVFPCQNNEPVAAA
jgi:transposase